MSELGCHFIPKHKDKERNILEKNAFRLPFEILSN
jgi:hypothetical protein